MNEREIKDFIKKYFLEKLPIGILLAAILLVFQILFYLSDYEQSVFRYGLILVASCIAFYLVFDLANSLRTYKQLKEMENELAVKWTPFYGGGKSSDEIYHRIIEQLYHRKSKVELEQKKALNELLEYYSTWVHQIKTPISAMRMLIEEEEISKKEVKEQLFFVEQYIEMALGYIRIQSISGDLLIESYSLESIVKQCIRKYGFLFIRKSIGVELGDLSARVCTDEKWFAFALEQFISNSLKYTKKGKIVIDTLKIDERHQYLCIKDSGIGIAEEDLPRVFEKGFTGYNGRMDKKASGIGLFLAKTICDRLLMDIEIESKPGEGTLVRIKLTTM